MRRLARGSFRECPLRAVAQTFKSFIFQKSRMAESLAELSLKLSGLHIAGSANQFGSQVQRAVLPVWNIPEIRPAPAE